MDGGKVEKPIIGIQRMSSAKRAILIPQKTNIRLDLESLANANPSDAKSRRPSLGKNPVVSASVSIDKAPSLSRPSSHYAGPLSARTADDAFLPESKIAQFLEDVPTVGLTKEDSKIIRTRVIEEMYRIQQRQQISPEERQRLYQLAISMDAPKLARKLVAEGKEFAEDYSVGSYGSDGDEHGTKQGQQPVSSFLTGEYHIPQSQKTPPRTHNQAMSSPKGSQSEKSHATQETTHNKPKNVNNNLDDDDDLFCKAFDEVERIRQRMIQRVNTATVISSTATNNTPQSARQQQSHQQPQQQQQQQQQPLSGRRLSGDNVQNVRRKSLSPKPTGAPQNIFSAKQSDHNNNPHNNHPHHNSHHNQHHQHQHQHHPHQSASKIHPTVASNDQQQSTTLQKQQSQFLHDLLTPRTPDRPSQNHTPNTAHTNSGNSKGKASHHHHHHHPHSQLHPFTPTISVDSEPSLNVHEALDSILGSNSHSHSHLHSQPNSRSLSGRKKSALSSYHRILAAADAHSDDSAHSSDNDERHHHHQKGAGAYESDSSSEGEHEAAQVVDLSSYGSLRRPGQDGMDDDNDSENGDTAAVIATTDDDNVYPSNHSSLDSESKRALEGLRRHDSFRNNKSSATKLTQDTNHHKHHTSHHHPHHHHNHHHHNTPHQKVPPLQTTNYTNDSKDITTVKPKSARLAPLLDPTGQMNNDSSNSIATEANTNNTNQNNNNNVSLKMISSLANKRQLRHQQPPAPSAGQRMPPGYLMIASPLSDWIQASNSGLITPMSQLPPLTTSQSTTTIQPSPHHLTTSASSVSLSTTHLQPTPSAVVMRPHTSLFTPSDLHTHEEHDASSSDRHASLRQSRFTFTPQETTNDDLKTHQDTVQQTPMAWNNLDVLTSTAMQQNPDWQNLKRSLDLLKDHMPTSTASTSSTQFFAGASPLATPSHVALSGLTSPSFQPSQPFQRPTSSSSSSASSASSVSLASGATAMPNSTSATTTAQMLLQQSFRRPVAVSSSVPTANSSPHSSEGVGLKKTSSFRHAGDLLLAKNIVDAATTSSSNFNHTGIAQSTLKHVALKNLTQGSHAVSQPQDTQQQPAGMPPMLKREASVQPFQIQQVGNTSHFISSSSNSSSVTNTPTPGSMPSSSQTVKSVLSSNNTTNNNSSSRMFALAAALDAGDAVGKLMADMMMLGTPTGDGGNNHHSHTLRIAK